MRTTRAAHARNLVGPLVRSAYRIEVRCVENLPLQGPILVLCDWNNIAAPTVLKAGLPRPVHVWAAGPAALPGPLLSITGDLAVPDGRPGVDVLRAATDLLDKGEAVAAIGVLDVGYALARTGAPVLTASIMAPTTKRPTDPPSRKSTITVKLGAPHRLPDRVRFASPSPPPTRGTVLAAGEWARQRSADEVGGR